MKTYKTPVDLVLPTDGRPTAVAGGLPNDGALLPAVLALDEAIHRVLIAGGDYGDELSDTGLRDTLKKAQYVAYRALISIGIEQLPGAVNPLRVFLPKGEVIPSAAPRPAPMGAGSLSGIDSGYQSGTLTSIGNEVAISLHYSGRSQGEAAFEAITAAAERPSASGAVDLPDTLSAMLWLYRRLPRTYGRPTSIETAITGLAKATGTEIGESFTERDEARVPITLDDMRMVLCPTCGNKRCPRATDHRQACTSSNEPGQAGSSYANQPAPSGASVDSDLLPCPFCGAKPLTQEIEAHSHAGSIASFMPDHPGSATIECPTTNGCGMIADTATEARAVWNRRASVDSVGIRAALNEYYDALTARQHGGVAQDRAFQKIEMAMRMSWDARKAEVAAMPPTKAEEAEP